MNFLFEHKKVPVKTLNSCLWENLQVLTREIGLYKRSIKVSQQRKATDTSVKYGRKTALHYYIDAPSVVAAVMY